MLTKLFSLLYVPSVPGTNAQAASHSCPVVPPDGAGGEDAPPDSGGPPLPEGCRWGVVCPQGTGGNESGACAIGLICD